MAVNHVTIQHGTQFNVTGSAITLLSESPAQPSVAEHNQERVSVEV